MNFNNSHNQRRVLRSALGVSVLMLASQVALAGGLQNGNGAVNSFAAWAYGIVGACAGVYLLYEGGKCWFGHGNWVNDLGGAFLKVCATGGTSVLAVYAWTMFTS